MTLSVPCAKLRLSGEMGIIKTRFVTKPGHEDILSFRQEGKTVVTDLIKNATKY